MTEQEQVIIEPSENHPPSRLVIVEETYYQCRGEEPFQLTSRYVRHLDTEEQPYQRKITVTEEWQELDYGWVEDISLVYIVNEEGRNRRTVPSAEELEESARKVVEATIGTHLVFSPEKVDGEPPVFLIPPGEAFKAYPAGNTGIYVRSQLGNTNCTITILPK